MLILVVLVLALAFANARTPFVRPSVHLNETHLYVNKIIGGVPANDGQFPYMVSLNYVGDGHACGASIVNQNWVLTAAHCCLTGNALEVYVGSIYLSRDGQTYPIDQYIIHGDYAPDSHWKNDICLIHVARPIQYNDRVQPVTLPPRDLNIPSGDALTIPGWGVDGQGNGPDRLQVLNNDRALSNEECIQKTGVDIIPGQLCVYAGNNLAVCSGDSGGPLSRNGVQVGLTSWGYTPCGTTGMPDVFTRVSYYVDWISQVMGNQAKDIKFATPEDLA